MTVFLGFLFWLSVLAMAHSYALYPVLVRWLAKGKKPNAFVFAADDPQLPRVSIMMAVYNEERVLEQKLRSVFDNDYPADRWELLVGSDNSADGTHAILERYAALYPQRLRYTVFAERQGKANILNQLQRQAQGSVYIFTDANVFFERDLIFQLVRHFKNLEVGQVGAAFVNKTLGNKGISGHEKRYIGRETSVKYAEGLLWGTMMGAFGGCHAVRAECFVPNPPGFFMEDFYLSMHVLSMGKMALLEPQALVYEDVPDEMAEEFKRKKRISIGNFQNLKAYSRLLWASRPGLAFSFWSHKVLRWLGPFFILAALLASGLLWWLGGNLFYGILFLMQLTGLFGVPLLDALLRGMGLHLWLLRGISYFNAMNLALLVGFFHYIKGVKSNVWQPTKRNA